MPKYAHKQDSVAKDIDEALEQIPGVSIWKLGNGTIDRVIGYRGVNYLIEYKSKNGRRTPKQIKFFQTWTGSVYICKTLQEVLEVIGIEKAI